MSSSFAHRHARRLTLGVLTATLMGLTTTPALAQAAQTLYVAPAPAGLNAGNRCTAQSNPCATVGYALTQATAGATLNLSAGTFNEAISVSQSDDADVTLVGAGAGAGGTVITSSGVPVTVGEPGVTLSDLAIDATGTESAVLGAGQNETLDGVAVGMQNRASGAIAVQSGPGATLDDSAVSGAWTGQGLVANGSLTLTGDAITSSATATQNLVTLNGTSTSDHFEVVDTMLDQANADPGSLPAYDLGVVNGYLVVDSSLLVGGRTALLINQSIPAWARIISSTLDAATPGVGDPGDTGLTLAANGAAATASLIGSITLEPQAAVVDGGSATVTCSDSDVPGQLQSAAATQGTVSCQTATAGNSSSTPDAIFADPSGSFSNLPTDYGLTPSWGGVNSVPESAVSLPAGYTPSAVDLLGNPRVTNASDTCAAPVRDRGAIELTATDGPAIDTISGPVNAIPGQNVGFTALGAIPPGSSVVADSWQSSDGATGTGTTFTHSFGVVGTYTVTLTTRTSTGCSASVEHVVTVTHKPQTATAAGTGLGAGTTASPGTTATPAAATSGSSAKASNLFTLGTDQITANGTVTLRVHLPGAGVLNVLETAWNNDLLSPSGRAHAHALEPLPGRFAFARATLIVRHKGAFTIKVFPSALGRRLIAHHRFAITVRQWLRFTPTGGKSHTIGITGLRLS